MRKYKCGCRVVLDGEELPESRLAGNGWWEQENDRDGKHRVNPCEKHMKNVVVRYGVKRIMGAVKGKAS